MVKTILSKERFFSFFFFKQLKWQFAMCPSIIRILVTILRWAQTPNIGSFGKHPHRPGRLESILVFGGKQMYCTKLVTKQLVYLPGQKVQPGPSTVSDRPVTAENVIYEASVVMGEQGGASLHCLHGVKKMRRQGHSSSPKLLYTFPALQKSNTEKHPISPILTNASYITVSSKTELSETLLGPGQTLQPVK